MVTHWLLRAKDGNNFNNSKNVRIWGIKRRRNKSFMKNVRPGDILWFVTCDSGGKIIAVATYVSHNSRGIGTRSNAELGWSGDISEIDTEIHYTDVYDELGNCNLLTRILGQTPVREYNDKCAINLPVEYSYIAKTRQLQI